MRSLRGLLQQARASRKGAVLRLGPAADPGSSSLARLPIELHIILLSYLDQEDVVAALDASKILRLVWLSDDIWPWLAERWHPGLAEALRAEANQQLTALGKGESIGAGALDPSELFLQRQRRISRRTTGKCASMLHLRMELDADPVFFSLSKSVSQDDGGIHSLDQLGEELEGSLKRASHPVSPFVRLMVYNNGRIAWWPESFAAPYIAVVDDLRTAKRRIYQFPHHGNVQKGYKTAMSDKLLVLGRDKIIHAWHFGKDALASVEVPEVFERCIAEGPVVVIITRSSEVYLWKFGENLLRLAFSSLGCYQPGPIRVGGLVDSPLLAHSPPFPIPRRQGLVLKENEMRLDFIPHPYIGQVIFAVTMHQGRVIVHMTDHGKLVQTYHLQHEAATSTELWNQFHEYLRWEKCDSHGGYRLFSAYVNEDDGFAPKDLPCPEGPCCTCTQVAGFVSVCFNIHTKTFDVQCHHFPCAWRSDDFVFDRIPRPAAFHLWDTKLYVSYDADSMRLGMPMTALRCCREVEETMYSIAMRDTPMVSNTPVHTVSNSSFRDILARRHTVLLEETRTRFFPTCPIQSAVWRIEFAFGLDVTADFAAESVKRQFPSALGAKNLWKWTGHNCHQTIVGDDDFLVYVVDGAYMVWSFGDEIPVPKNKNRGDKWTPWKRTVDQFKNT